MSSNSSSPRKNLASKYLEAIGSPIDTTLRPSSLSRSNTAFGENIELNSMRSSNLKENENPFKSPTKRNIGLSSNLTSSPSFKNGLSQRSKEGGESPVKRLILQKERDTIENSGGDFVPLPPLGAKKLTFTKSTQDSADNNGNPSKSQRKTMGNIAISMSNSPSLKNLNKLKSIEKRLISRSESSNKLKLPRDPSYQNLSSSWMDTDRKSLQTLEFLLRIKEAKKWLEYVLDKDIKLDQDDSIVEFQEYLRNGIVLAMVTQKFLPSSVKSIYYGDKPLTDDINFKNKSGLYFRFTENITNFLKFLKTLNLPDMYIFETTDLFEMKNFPKVVFCIHALSHYLSLQGKAPKMSHLKLNKEDKDVNEEELKKMNVKLRGIKLPNFENLDTSLQHSQSQSVAMVQKTTPKEDYHLDVLEEDLDEARSLFRESYVSKAPAIDMDEIDKIHEKYNQMTIHDNGLSLSLRPNSSTLTDDNELVIELQAIARGSILRYQLFVDKFMLKAFTNNVISLQALIRGNIVRNKNKSNFRKLNDNMRSLSVLQAILKTRKKDDKVTKVQKKLSIYKGDIVELQSIARGFLARQTKKDNRKLLLRKTNAIIKLQSIIRGNFARNLSVSVYGNLHPLPALPGAHKRTIIVEKRFVDKPVKLTESTRQRYDDRTEGEITFESVFVELQSIIRGGLSRNRLNRVLDTIYTDENEDSVTQLGAIARGQLVRREIKQMKRSLKKNAKPILHLQSVIRGTLVRFESELLIDEVEENLLELNEFKGLIRGVLVRERIKERDEYFRRPENVAKIIKLQSYFRSMKEIHSYTSLIKESNPNLKVIRHFINVLNIESSESDIEDDSTIKKYKDSILIETKKIEKWEAELNQLEVKIKLLRRNKISLDELIEFKDNHLSLSEYSHNLNDSLNKSINGSKDEEFKKVHKSKTILTTLFERLFYLLQTKNDYLSRLLFHIDENFKYLHDRNYDESIIKIFNMKPVIENNNNSSGLSSYFDFQDSNKREEFLLMKLIVFTSEEYFSNNFDSIKDLKKYEKSKNTLKATMKYSKSWEVLLSDFINLPQQRIIVKQIFSDCILRVSNDYESSYESNPSEIYRDLCQQDSNKDEDFLKDNDPIDDEETKEKFVDNLSRLREASYDIMKIIMASIPKLPVFIRCVCKEILKVIKKQFPGEPERFYLSVIGKLFIKTYVLPIFLQPETFGIDVSKFSENYEEVERIKKNLVEVAKVINQLIVMRQFDKEYVYLQPLNPFIEEFVEQCRILLRDLIDVDTLESCYDLDVNYSDLTLNNKPVLSLDESNLIGIIDLLNEEIDIVAPGKDDYLRYLLFEIDGMISMSKNHNLKDLLELNGNKTRNNLFNFNLKPVSKNIVEDTQNLMVNSLMLEAKRYLIYILQIQDGEDLLDILVSPVSKIHELKFKKLIEKNIKNKDVIMDKVNNIPERRVINDIYNAKYPSIKKRCLEIILELEKMGKVSRMDGFQDVLNYIGSDIKDLRELKESKERELQVVIDTLTKLKQKERECSKMYKDYLNDIDVAMMKLQSKAAEKSLNSSKNKNNKFFNFKQYFNKQYYYHRELKKKRGSVPRFGSFKYSSKYLYEHRILLEINGSSHLNFQSSFGASIGSKSSKHSSSSTAAITVNKTYIMFSCEKVGEFLLNLSTSSNVEKLTLDYLLNLQYEEKKTFSLFYDSLLFDTDAFISFIFKRFYEVS